jgi:pleiotropic regulator 1
MWTSVSPCKKDYQHSATMIPRLASKWPKPEWHAPWKLYRVISGRGLHSFTFQLNLSRL